MSDYGFTLKINDLTSSKLKQIENAMKSTSSTVKTETGSMQDNFGKLGEAAQSMGRMIIEAFSVYEIYNFGKELLSVATEFQTFANVIKYSSNGVVDNAQNINYLNDAIIRLHLPMQQAYQQFSEMQAGMVGTGIEGEKLRKIFEGVAEAATVMHLDPDRFSRTTYALKEIGELGTVQMRQMRMLAIALPGAMSIAARAMGMNSSQFHEAMKKGKINSADFLPKFAAGLTARFNPGLANAGQSLMSQVNDEKNAILKLMLDMGDSLEPLFLDILHTIKSGMEGLKNVWDTLSGNSNFVNALKEIFDWAVKLIPIWITYRGVMMAANIVTKVFAVSNGILTASFGELTIMTDGATVATEGFSSAIAATGIGALVIGLGLVVEKFFAMNREADEFASKITNIDKLTTLSKANTDAYTDVKNRLSLRGTKDETDQTQLLKDVLQLKSKDEKDLKETFVPSTNASKLALDTLRKNAINSSRAILGSYNSMYGSGYVNFHKSNKESDDADQKRAITVEQREKLAEQTKNLAQAIKEITQNLGKVLPKGFKRKNGQLIAPIDDFNTGNPGTANALNTSSLAGASGGLGSAKIVNIHIDTFQKNEGVKESRSQADSTLEKLTEIINSFSDSVNSQ